MDTQARAAIQQQIDDLLAGIAEQQRSATAEELQELERLRASMVTTPAPPAPQPVNIQVNERQTLANQLVENLRSLVSRDNPMQTVEMSLEQVRAVNQADVASTNRRRPIVIGDNRGNLYGRFNWVDSPGGNTAFPVGTRTAGAFSAPGTDAVDAVALTAKSLTPKRISGCTYMPVGTYEGFGADFFAPIVDDIMTSIYTGIEKQYLSKTAADANTPAGIFAGSPATTTGAIPTAAELIAVLASVRKKSESKSSFAWVMDADVFYACAQLVYPGTQVAIGDIVNERLLGCDVIISEYAPANLGAGTKKGIALVDTSDVAACIFPRVVLTLDMSQIRKGLVGVVADAMADYVQIRDAVAVRQLA